MKEYDRYFFLYKHYGHSTKQIKWSALDWCLRSKNPPSLKGSNKILKNLNACMKQYFVWASKSKINFSAMSVFLSHTQCDIKPNYLSSQDWMPLTLFFHMRSQARAWRPTEDSFHAKSVARPNTIALCYTVLLYKQQRRQMRRGGVCAKRRIWLTICKPAAPCWWMLLIRNSQLKNNNRNQARNDVRRWRCMCVCSSFSVCR